MQSKEHVQYLGGVRSKALPFFPAAFFQDCISEQDLDEMNIEIIRNTLYKVKSLHLSKKILSIFHCRILY